MIHLPAVGPELPVHPFTGLTAIGFRRNGDPIWPVRGGSEDGDAGDAGGDGESDGDPEGADALSDPGKKALDAMKSKWQQEKAARKALADELASLKAGRQGNDKNGDQPDPDEIRKQARAEAQAEVLRDRAMDKVEAKAAKLFADPEDARALLAGRVDEFVDGGKVDADAIDEALADLLEKKPHLAAQGGRRFQGSGDGGHRGGGKPNVQPGLGRLQYAYAQSTNKRS